ncbi:hypothetical protein CDAR_605541 [Caerostris darwini]|uniref:Uncharacterized protein n=1 Tax=Caerostris darwini TaxID=1538125 RepID=A0AAV4RCK9_9ARAC|nr:hypothetical protein CDAR_605541 [Caerostris darwini]
MLENPDDASLGFRLPIKFRLRGVDNGGGNLPFPADANKQLLRKYQPNSSTPFDLSLLPNPASKLGNSARFTLATGLSSSLLSGAIT